MFEVYAQDYRITIQEIPLGNQGEDMARCLVIDITDAVNEFGSGGTVSVRNKRNGDELPYFCTNVSTVTGADAEGNVHTYIKWTLTDVDTAVSGSGFVQADYIISGVTVKTWVYKYFILPSLGITGDVPDPYEDILEEIEAQVSAVQAAAASAAASAAQASAEATRIITTTESVVEDWLSDHIVTGYTVDDTLTISGAAADSKKAGDMIRAAFVTEQTSGSIASFTDGADDVPLKDLVVNISPVQSGTGDPSPTNIRPITGFDAANVFVDGVNILRYRSDIPSSTTLSGITYTVNADGSVTMNGTSTSTNGFALTRATEPCPFKPGLTYRFRMFGGYDGTNGYGNLQLYIDGISMFTSSDRTFTMPDHFDAAYLRIRLGGGNTIDNATVYPMVTLESQWGGIYEQYCGTKYPVSFGSAGTVYGGTLDVTTGMLTMTWASVNLGGLGYGGGNGSYFYTSISNKAYGAENIMCSIYKTVNTPAVEMPNYSIKGGGGNNSIFIMDNRYTTTAELRTALDGINAVYELAQPISVQLDPVTITSLIGNNNIWSDTGSVSSCEYRADTKLYLEKLTTPDDDMVANANITSGSYFMVGNSLYLATANIANGGAITPGTNCTATNLAAALNAINS